MDTFYFCWVYNTIFNLTQVYDRLQKERVCLGYEATSNLLDAIGETMKQAVTDIVNKKQRFRLVGDNINWKVDVHDQRIDNQATMYHAFGSAILVQNVDFSAYSNEPPTLDNLTVTVNHFIPGLENYDIYRHDYTILMYRAVFKFIPLFGQFENVVPEKNQ